MRNSNLQSRLPLLSLRHFGSCTSDIYCHISQSTLIPVRFVYARARVGEHFRSKTFKLSIANTYYWTTAAICNRPEPITNCHLLYIIVQPPCFLPFVRFPPILLAEALLTFAAPASTPHSLTTKITEKAKRWLGLNHSWNRSTRSRVKYDTNIALYQIWHSLLCRFL